MNCYLATAPSFCVRHMRGGLAALLLLTAAPAMTHAQGAYTLRLKPKLGDVSKYQMTMKMTMALPQGPQGQPMTVPIDITATQEQKVTKVFPTGGGEVVTTTLDQSTTMNGQPFNMQQKTPPITVSYDGQGRMISTKGVTGPMAGMLGGGSGGGMNPTGLSSMGMYLPAKPVKPGDTWTQAIAIPMLTGGKSGTAKCTFLKVENIGRYKTARIRMVVTMPMNLMMGQNGQPTRNAKAAMMTMSGTTTAVMENNFAIAEGKLIRLAGNGNTSMAMHPSKSAASGGKTPPGLANGMKMTMKMNMAMDLVQ